MMPWCIKMAVSACGLGLLPKAPGTWGSLPPVLVVLVCGHFHICPIITLGILIFFIIAMSIVTITAAPWYEAHFGQKDPPQVVSDEVSGQSIALLGMAWLSPPTEQPEIWIGLAILSFVLFRLFDIWKPGLIDTAQRIKGGWGVLLDDVFAGIVAGGIILIIATMFVR